MTPFEPSIRYKPGLIGRTMGPQFAYMGVLIEQDLRNALTGHSLTDMDAACNDIYEKAYKHLSLWNSQKAQFFRDRDETLRSFLQQLRERILPPSEMTWGGSPKFQRFYKVVQLCHEPDCPEPTHMTYHPVTSYVFEHQLRSGELSDFISTTHTTEKGVHPVSVFSAGNALQFNGDEQISSVHTRLKSEARFLFKLTRRILYGEADMHDTIGAKVVLAPGHESHDDALRIQRLLVQEFAEGQKAVGRVDDYFRHPKVRVKDTSSAPEHFRAINLPIKYSPSTQQLPIHMEVQITPAYVFKKEEDKTSALYHPLYARSELDRKVFSIDPADRLHFLMALNALNQFWNYTGTWKTISLDALADIEKTTDISQLLIT